jgi:arylsulfatase A-like enzyme
VRTIALLLSLASLLAGCERRPDVVLVTFDTLRRDHVGAYGFAGPGPSPTPNLDLLAERARVFEGALTTMPTTVPAHASIFTGLHPRDHRLFRNADRLDRTLAAERSLPRRLRAAGYQVAAFVTSDVFGGAMGLGGFDPYDDEGTPLRPGSAAVDAALEWLDLVQPRPFFLWLHLYDPHAPYGTAAEKRAHLPVDRKSYGWVDRARYRDPNARRAMAERYAAGVREADAAFGRLLGGLDARGREPLLLVVSDHGELLAERLDHTGFAYGHGSLLGPEVLFVPLVVAGAGVEPARVGGAVSVTDLYTTILAAVGLGDPGGAAEGRVDLRADPPAGRVVTAARRLYDPAERRKRRIGAEALRAIRAGAVAASDGAALLVVGEDGGAADGAARSAALAEAAKLALAAQAAGEKAGPATKVAPDTRRKLEALGYVEGDEQAARE